MFYKLCFGLILIQFLHAEAENTSSLTPSQVREFEQNVTAMCGEKYQVKHQKVEEFFKDMSLSPRVTEDLKCFFSCVLLNWGILKDQKLDLSKILSEQELVSLTVKAEELESIKKCHSKADEGLNICDLSYNFANCVRKEIVKNDRAKLNEENLPWFEMSSFSTCAKKLNVNNNVATAVLTGGKTEDRNVKCVFRCLDEFLGLINPDTKKLDWDLREKLERIRLTKRQNEVETALKYINSCKAKGMQNLDDECESSYLANECFTQAYQNTEKSK